MEMTGLFHVTPAWLTYPLLTAAGIVGGIVVSRVVEYPLMALVRRRFFTRTTRPTAAA
jgi:hypothetical protein